MGSSISGNTGVADPVNYFSPSPVNAVRRPVPPSGRDGLRGNLTPTRRQNCASSNFAGISSGVIPYAESVLPCRDISTVLNLQSSVRARALSLKGGPPAFRHNAVLYYLRIGPTPSLKDTPLFNPVVRPAGHLPISDGGVHRHRFTIQRDRPMFRTETEYDFLSTTAAALVRGCPVSEAHIENTFLDVFRDRLGDLKS